MKRTCTAALAVAIMTGCAPAEETPDPEDQTVRCVGDELDDEAPIGTSLAALETRWDTNQELVRALFVGEPL